MSSYEARAVYVKIRTEKGTKPQSEIRPDVRDSHGDAQATVGTNATGTEPIG
jgi:hypothetical protein